MLSQLLFLSIFEHFLLISRSLPDGKRVLLCVRHAYSWMMRYSIISAKQNYTTTIYPADTPPFRTHRSKGCHSTPSNITFVLWIASQFLIAARVSLNVPIHHSSFPTFFLNLIFSIPHHPIELQRRQGSSSAAA